MVSDAMTLSKFADTTLYLVRQGHTYKKQISLIDELYQESKLPKVSIIINDVKIKPGYGYYGYGDTATVMAMVMAADIMRKKNPRSFVEKIFPEVRSTKMFSIRRK